MISPNHQLGGPGHWLRCDHPYLGPLGPGERNHRSSLRVGRLGVTEGIDLVAGEHTALQRRGSHPLHPGPYLDAAEEDLALRQWRARKAIMVLPGTKPSPLE